jgi:hypothetical protein
MTGEKAATAAQIRTVTNTPPANADIMLGRCTQKMNGRRLTVNQGVTAWPTRDGYASIHTKFIVTHKDFF